MPGETSRPALVLAPSKPLAPLGINVVIDVTKPAVSPPGRQVAPIPDGE